MINTKKVDELIDKYLDKERLRIWAEIDLFRQGKINKKELTKGTEQILRTIGEYYERH